MLPLANFNRPLQHLKPIRPVNLVLAHLHGAQSSGRALRTDYGASTNRASAGHNILPNPPKSPSQIPTFNVTPNAPTTDFDDALNRFKDELAKSLESSLGVQLKSSRNTYQKPYPSTYDFMKAPDGWMVPDF